MKSILFLFVFLLVSTYAEHEGVNWAAIHANNQAGRTWQSYHHAMMHI